MVVTECGTIKGSETSPKDEPRAGRTPGAAFGPEMPAFRAQAGFFRYSVYSPEGAESPEFDFWGLELKRKRGKVPESG
jgi:hypothetical protein